VTRSADPNAEPFLSLRFRDRGDSTGATDLEAFLPSRYGDRSTAAAYRGARERRAAPGEVLLDGIDGMSVRVSAARRGPVLRVGSDPILPVFFASSELAIPRVGEEIETAEVIYWNFRETDTGYLALTTVDRDGLPRPSRGLTLVAALLPLTVLPTTALAAPGTGGTLPVLAAPAEAPKAKAAPAEDPVAPAPTGAAVDPSKGPDTATAAPIVHPSGAAAGPTPAGIWGALIGSDIRLTMKDGSSLEGRLLGVHGSVLVAARVTDGLVVAIDQGQVAQANALTPVREKGPRVMPPARGTGLLVGGAIMTAVAGGLLIGGIAAGAYCARYDTNYYSYYGGTTGGDDGCWYYWVPLVVPAAALAAGGIPMIVIGKKRRDAWKKQVEVATITPGVRRTRTGWTGALTLRF
jgi:hypothetical protein